ncbi:MATE family efflux transporter [Ameyamaea chiangmaiensis]|uniref:Multidrug-efflux transporter n=2 Tax=Ameyamaea chiangmaiensis TaxID=442969 RepID=A0A850PEG8_9PROT|nr:MATE family efflux transporter [Ameyamaea chiangmaiensis]NVN40332.1 MATE family efflux transporter [Ameyamaea chiangmaiensis]
MTEIEHACGVTLWSEVRALVKTALPLGVGELSQMAMGVSDSMLLGRLGPDALAVAALSTTFYFTVTATARAALGAGGVFIARAFGGQRVRDIAVVHAMTVVMGLLMCVPCALVLANAGRFLLWIGEPPEIAALSGRFIHILCWSLPASIVGVGVPYEVLPALRAQKVLLWLMPSALVLNVLLNAGLVFGLAGLPRMGLWGSATATMVTGWGCGVALYGVLLGASRRRVVLWPPRGDWSMLVRLLRFGLPMSIAAAAEVMMFQASGLRAGFFGMQALAAHGIALNVTTMTFMVSFAMAQAANMRVGHLMGAGRVGQVRKAATAALGLVVAYSAATALVLLMLPGWIAGLYMGGAPSGRETVALAAVLLGVAALYQVVDGIQVMLMNLLRAFGDSLVPMLLAGVGYWFIGFPVGGWLAFQRGWGVAGLWWGLAVGLASVSLMLAIRFFVMRSRLVAGARSAASPNVAETWPR